MTEHKTVKAIIDAYMRRTQQSRAQDEIAKGVLPGGDTRTGVYFFPYPTYMERGEGCYIYDADGNRYIDFHNNYVSLIHGHGHPAVVKAVQAQVEIGTIFGAPAASQHVLGSMLCERIPSVESVRFCNSGTEATMMAMRVARAFTGKDVILKMDGGYHGTHDFAEVNITATTDTDGLPPLRRENRGIPACILDGVMVVHFNDLDAVEEILSTYGHRIAAVIVEPILNAGGLVPAREGYLAGLRQLTDKYGVLLIFDEMMTFRLSLGGIQRLEGVEPDITALGKIIGGGFPVGAVGGKQEIMALFDPSRTDGIKHSGTFNGNNITMAAGIATLQHYGQPEIDHLDTLGEKLRQSFRQAFAARGLKGRITGRGSVAYIHWTDQEILTAADASRAAKQAGQVPQLLHLGLLNRGIWAAPRGEFCLSTPMTENEVDQAIATLDAVLGVLKPYIEDSAPHLLLPQ